MKHIGRCPYMINDDLADIYEETILREFAPVNPVVEGHLTGGFQGQQPLQQQQLQPQQRPQLRTGGRISAPQQTQQLGNASPVPPQSPNNKEKMLAAFKTFADLAKGAIDPKDLEAWQNYLNGLSVPDPNLNQNPNKGRGSENTQSTQSGGYERELKAALGAG